MRNAGTCSSLETTQNDGVGIWVRLLPVYRRDYTTDIKSPHSVVSCYPGVAFCGDLRFGHEYLGCRTGVILVVSFRAVLRILQAVDLLHEHTTSTILK